MVNDYKSIVSKSPSSGVVPCSKWPEILPKINGDYENTYQLGGSCKQLDGEKPRAGHSWVVRYPTYGRPATKPPSFDADRYAGGLSKLNQALLKGQGSTIHEAEGFFSIFTYVGLIFGSF